MALKTAVRPAAQAPSAEGPKSTWERVLSYTPVVMTVVATLLAGLSTGEMTAAQYERASGAQMQSKVADQWNFFQVKKIRGSAMDNSLDLLHGLSPPTEFDAGAVGPAVGRLAAALHRAAELVAQASGAAEGEWNARCARDGEIIRRGVERAEKLGSDAAGVIADAGAGAALEQAQSAEPIRVAVRPVDPAIKAAEDAIEAQRPEGEIAGLVARIGSGAWDEAFTNAEGATAAFDGAVGPVTRTLDRLKAVVDGENAAAAELGRAVRDLNAGEAPAEVRGSLAALAASATEVQGEAMAQSAALAGLRLGFGSRRYAQEAGYNRAVAQLEEIEVRRSNIEAERHRLRSRRFFIGVLAAQAGVIAATMALAVRQRNALWMVATVAGLIAVAFGVYVYLFT